MHGVETTSKFQSRLYFYLQPKLNTLVSTLKNAVETTLIQHENARREKLANYECQYVTQHSSGML